MSLLTVTGLNAHYGKSHILTGVDLTVNEGEIISVLGRNGSGRSTMLKAIIGLVKPSKGSVALRGKELAGLPAHEIVRSGLAFVPEDRLIFDNLTVDENLAIGVGRTKVATTRWTVDEMYDYFPRLRERRSAKAGNLSGGEQQMLTLCRSLLGNPEVMLVDEPTEGLAPQIVEHLVSVLLDIRKRGVAIVLVEQKMTIALRIAQRCLIMGRGQIVFNGSPEQLKNDAEVRRTWLEVA